MPPRHRPESQNLIIAFALSMLVLVYWEYFVEAPRRQAEEIAQRQQAHVEEQAREREAEKEPASLPKTRTEWLAATPRLPIRSPRLHGSIALTGLRIDDLTLATYREGLASDSPEVVLLSPPGDANGYFAEFGWTSDDSALALPKPDTLWAADGAELTPDHPVTLTWQSPDGVTFAVKIALDPNYMFTVSQSVTGNGKKITAVHSYAYINRVYDIKTHPSLNILHEGPIGVLDGILKETTYKKLTEEKDEAFEAQSGWLGITDKYWLATFAPEGTFNARYSYYQSKGRDHFQTDYSSTQSADTTVHFFAGAKEMALLDDYAAQYHIPRFDHAVDLGWFDFLTKPIFETLTFFYKLLGNFGLAILLLTVIVKAIMFPLASKSFRAMNQMKTLQPKMAELRERYKDDKLKMNQAVMELYKKEKVNPASGCLPIFVQIPVFFSLYKVLYVTIEMRHAPFFGWIHDLSAPDPTNLFTLFGALHWVPPGFLHLGIWPMIMCLTMVIQQSQSPPPPDPAQARVMKAMPFLFLFLFSSFPAGLVIYWCWSNTLSILQQWYIKQRHGTPAVKKK